MADEITTADVVKGWLNSNGVGSALDDEIFTTAYNAAESYVSSRCRVGESPEKDLVLAVCLQTARYLARRNSVTAIIGIDDLALTIPGMDADVMRLMNPYRKVVFG